MSALGQLIQIKDLRSQWADEARDFTPWLAQSDNLALIGETLGFGHDWLEVVEVEASVGRFSADILCKDTASDDHFVIIENQFGKTDHDHLGKLLTYAAGRKAKTVIWIAEHVRDEHRAAIDLLNDATSDDYQFFALEIELWQIGESAIAPRFSIIAKPNEWARATKQAAKKRTTANLSELQKTYAEYWTDFKALLEDTTIIRAQKASPQQWIYMRLGRAKFSLTANVNSQQKFIQAQLELHDSEGGLFFKLLERQRAQIDAMCPFPLEWEELPNRKGSRISIQRDGDPVNQSDWPDQHAWLVEKLTVLYGLFHDRIKELDLDDLDEGIV